MEHLTLRIPRWVAAALAQLEILTGKKQRTIAREWLEEKAREVPGPAPKGRKR